MKQSPRVAVIPSECTRNQDDPMKSNHLYPLICLLAGALLGPHTVAGEAQRHATATFAGGCFWCMEPPFDAVDGVISTTSGYIGGHRKDPT